MPTLREYKEAFNILAERMRRAEIYFSKCTKEEEEKWMPELIKIIDQQGMIWNAITREQGYPPSSEEVYGFKLD